MVASGLSSELARMREEMLVRTDTSDRRSPASAVSAVQSPDTHTLTIDHRTQAMGM